MNIEKHFVIITSKPENRDLLTLIVRDDISTILSIVYGKPDREFITALEIILAAARDDTVS